METLYEKYKKLNLDGSWIGLTQADGDPYFCTPVGAEIIGWDNAIHYCFIEAWGDMVFCVNPETCCDFYVYPIAKTFRDFLRLILAVGTTNTLQQIIGWDQTLFEAFVAAPEEREYRSRPEVVQVLHTIRKTLQLTPMEAPFPYVKELQSQFPYAQICFSNDYYDTLGLERPDGTVPDANESEVESIAFRFE
ncbi:hypothetical protein [Flavonifractor hominis]|uniref:Uncharacterized protein n=1 Tax=Flavonifractor hominis TaxID=3133178 RepID=A0ABV1ERP8_9FIRM